MRALDYAYSYDNGKTREFARQTAVHVQSPLLRLPSFLLRPQSSLAKLGKILGLAHDIDFAEAPRFRGMFLLRSENEAAVRSLFTPGVIAQCEQLPGISIGGAGDALVVYRDRKLARVTDLPARLAEAKAIALLFITAAAATA